MDSHYALLLTVRWLHILAATMAVGVPIYIRFALLPAMQSLDEDTRTRLREASAKRWRMVVYMSIVIFLATGLYTFLVVKRWKGFEEHAMVTQYHIIFTIKFTLAFVLFFISSAVAGRSAKLAHFRTNAKMWLSIMILLGATILGLSAALRAIDNPRPAAIELSPADASLRNVPTGS